MKFLIDFDDAATETEINAYLSANECTVERVFSHFEKTYLVSCEAEPAEDAIVTSCLLEDESTKLKLLDTTMTMPPVQRFPVDTNADTDWWKYATFHGIFDQSEPVVDVIRKGRNHPIYLMDSGIDETHSDFAGANIRKLFTFVEGDHTDTNGHGTAIASVIAGDTKGISAAEVIDVKIFHKGVPTMRSDIVAAIDALVADYLASYSDIPAVVNMSWGITRDDYIDAKIINLIELGLIVVAAAGNNGVPIENVTPAALPEVITIGSVGPDMTPSDFSNYTDSDVSFSKGETNYGVGLDGWAPGEHIHAATLDGSFGNTAGTSIAAGIYSAAIAYQLGSAGWRYGQPLPLYNATISEAMDEGANPPTVDKALIRGALTQQAFVILYAAPGVILSEKYQNCTNRVVTIYGGLSLPMDTEGLNLDRNIVRVLPVGRGDAVYKMVLDRSRFSEVSFGSLPTGLSFDANDILVGTMDYDLPDGDAHETILVPVTLKDGDETHSYNLMILYFDRTRFDPTWSNEDAIAAFRDADTNIELYDCAKCPENGGGFSPCGGQCQPCLACQNLKDNHEVCGPSC
jgi:hypothetical protein